MINDLSAVCRRRSSEEFARTPDVTLHYWLSVAYVNGGPIYRRIRLCYSKRDFRFDRQTRTLRTEYRRTTTKDVYLLHVVMFCGHIRNSVLENIRRFGKCNFRSEFNVITLPIIMFKKIYALIFFSRIFFVPRSREYSSLA